LRHLPVWIGTFVIALAACGSSKIDPDGGQADAESGAAQHFSFFVTSLRALQELSGNNLGFGGDLRFGETGLGAGLRGADKICGAIAERSKSGSSAKQWRAFLSAADDGTGKPVHAIDRIGTGPWYDRLGRTLAPTLASLLGTRPQGGDPAIANDFPNEDGVPNHRPDPTTEQVDNHDMLTGTNDRGQLYAATSTCLDWTSNTGDVTREGRPRVGHSWPRTGAAGGDGTLPPCDQDGGFVCDGGLSPPFGDGGFPPLDDGGFGPPLGDGGFPQPGDGGFGPRPGDPPPSGDGGFGPRGMSDGGFGPPSVGGVGDINNWMSSLDESGCAPGVSLIEMGAPQATSNTVGSGGGYGGFYCFALAP
jgi:hypothetical protein